VRRRLGARVAVLSASVTLVPFAAQQPTVQRKILITFSLRRRAGKVHEYINNGSASVQLIAVKPLTSLAP